MRTTLLGLTATTFVCFAACSSPPKPDHVSLTLAPGIVGSQSGTIEAEAAVTDGKQLLSGWSVLLHVDYTDRNGMAHMIADVTGKTDDSGTAATSFTGLSWEGSGTITASVLDGKGMPALDPKKDPVTISETFSVLDETPPSVMITAPADMAVIPRVGGGGGGPMDAPFTVTVNATDEIGISQIFVQVATSDGNTNIDRTSSKIVASGTTMGTASFNFDGRNTAPGTTATIYAMAADMSGNLAVSAPIMISIP
jgi:hypothetical protein